MNTNEKTDENGARRDVAVMPRADGTELRFSVGEYRGRAMFHVRQWFKADNGNWYPTRRGVTLPADLAGDFAAAVEALRREAEALDERLAERGGGRRRAAAP